MNKDTKMAKADIIAKRKAKMSNEQIARYKELATTRKDRMRYTQEYLGVLFNLANEYVLEKSEEGRPITIAGMQRKFGVTPQVWYQMRNGEKDHALYEFLAENDLPEDYADTIEQKIWNGVPLITYSEFIEGLYLRQQELLEEVCINKANPVGSIFLLKALHRFSDSANGLTINNNTLNVYQDKFGSLDEIEKARKLLG